MDRNQIALLLLAVAIFAVSLQFGGGTAPPPAAPPPVRAAEAGAGSAPAPATAATDPGVAPAPGDALEQAESVEQATLSNGGLSLQISNAGGRLRSVRLRDYAAHVGDSQPVELATDPEH